MTDEMIVRAVGRLAVDRPLRMLCVSRYTLVRVCNDVAHQEIKDAGSPRFPRPPQTGRRRSIIVRGPWYDPEQVWGVSEEDIKAFIERSRRQMRTWSPRRRAQARNSYYLWLTREAAMNGLSIGWG